MASSSKSFAIRQRIGVQRFMTRAIAKQAGPMERESGDAKIAAHGRSRR